MVGIESWRREQILFYIAKKWRLHINAQVPILVVEDDDLDAMTVQIAFDDLSISNPMVRAVNGREALDYLRKTDSILPGLILLDLNMPIMDGLEFLEIVKNDQHLKKLPTVILSTSKADEDVKKSFEFGVAGYIAKPLGYEEFLELMRVVHDYWSNSQSPT